MDHTAKLRSMKGAIEEMQNGEKAMAKKDFPTAEGHFRIEFAARKPPENHEVFGFSDPTGFLP